MKRSPLLAATNKLQDRYLLSYSSRNMLASLIKMFKGKPNGDLGSENARDLKRDGFVMLPELSYEDLSKILKIAMTGDLYDPWRSELGFFKLDDRDLKTSVARLRNPADYQVIADLAHSVLPAAIASNYFGAKCVIDSVDLWWSFPREGNPEEAENFHRDRDSTEFLKWFVYVTDVDDNSGPHELALNSVESSNFVKGGRYSDNDIYQLFETKKFLGRSGTNFLENTYGLHRGYKPTKERRLLFQVRYSIHGSSFRYRNKGVSTSIPENYVAYSYVSNAN